MFCYLKIKDFFNLCFMKRLEKTIVLTILFLLLVNFPFVAILDELKLTNNVPVLYLFFYILWALLIGLYYFIYKNNKT